MKSVKPVIFLTFANDKVDDALYLRNLPKELHGIRESLEDAAQAGLCEIVERTAATVEEIFDVFQDPTFKDRIAVFHYGGHAGGGLLMLETLEGGHGHSHSEGLVPFFAKQDSLQLVFFNGCSSQSQAEDMIKAGVPAVIGTSSAIDDGVATDLSVRFYNGLATGESIEQAWLQAIDLVKTKKGDNAGVGKETGHRGLRLRRDKADEFPWKMYVRRGAEDVKNWSLPMAANNPLFGLPELPKLNLPEKPFRYLRRYEREHAEIFFGRSRMIRALYEKIIDKNSDPVILFYGQSGVGKSSMLDSGLLPRLEAKVDVRYVRREEDLGLLGTLDKALGGTGYETLYIKTAKGDILNKDLVELKIKQIEDLTEGFDDTIVDAIQEQLEKVKTQLLNVEDEIEVTEEKNTQSRLERWRQIEEEDGEGEPLIILMDQVEEVFTRYRKGEPNELELFLGEIQAIFQNPNTRPKGKIILSYRKEFHPEIEEMCRKLRIPRQNLFLQHLNRDDIMEVVIGLISTEKLRNRYQLNIEPELPVIIADDLLEDKDSSIAPLLQILLTKLWEGVEKDTVRHFRVEDYQKLKNEGLLMDDFFQQRMERLKEWNPKLEESGLALDVLNYHITRSGTAGMRNMKQLGRRYKHKETILEELVEKLKDLFLLTEITKDRTGLAHDTIAPIIQKEIEKSEKPGQRAWRILNSNVKSYRKNPKMLLGRASVRTILRGKNGMRLWSSDEQELIDKSIKKIKKRNIQYGALVTLTVLALGFGVFESFLSSVLRKEAKEKQEQLSSSLEAVKEVANREKERAKIHERRSKLIEEAKQEAEGRSAELIAELEKVIVENDKLDRKNNAQTLDIRKLEDERLALQTELGKVQENLLSDNIERAALAQLTANRDSLTVQVQNLSIALEGNNSALQALQEKLTETETKLEEANKALEQFKTNDGGNGEEEENNGGTEDNKEEHQ